MTGKFRDVRREGSFKEPYRGAGHSSCAPNPSLPVRKEQGAQSWGISLFHFMVAWGREDCSHSDWPLAKNHS